jgi:hypothetical protein
VTFHFVDQHQHQEPLGNGRESNELVKFHGRFGQNGFARELIERQNAEVDWSKAQ